jgi:toxin ParE1/3/4
MTPVWSPEAIDDLYSLRDHISKDSPAAAQRVAQHIIHNVETLLPDNPHLGRAGRVPGTRELVIPNTPFVVPYRIHDGTLQILRIFHAARKWPEQF